MKRGRVSQRVKDAILKDLRGMSPAQIEAYAKQKAIKVATLNKWLAATVSLPKPGSSVGSSNSNATSVAATPQPTGPNIPNREPNFEAAQRAAGLLPQSAKPNDVPKAAAPAEVTPEQVVDLCEQAVAASAMAAAVYLKIPTDDSVVVKASKLSSSERGTLSLFAPSVARRMPELLGKLDAAAPYFMGGILVVISVMHAKEIKAYATEKRKREKQQSKGDSK